MPSVPTYDSFQAAPAALPGVRQESIASPALFRGPDRDTGAALMKAGKELTDIFVEEQKEVDKARVQEQFTKLSKAANASLYADGGVMNLSGSQAVGAGEKWSADYDKIAGELTAELHPRQAQQFQHVVQTTKRTYHDNVMRHEFNQIKSYKDETAKAAIDQALENTGANYQDGETVGMQINLARGVLLDRPEYKGASPEVRQRMDAALEGSFHARVVQSALDAGNTAYAKAWFDANRERIPLELRGKVEKQMKPATDFAEGKQLALDAQGKIAAGESITAVEAWINEKAGSREALGVAQAMMAQQQEAQRRQQAHDRGGFLERFESAPSHKTFTAIMGDRGFQKLEPETRGNLMKYMRAELEQAGDRARARQNDTFRSPEAFGKFIDTLESPGFGSLSRQEIYNLRPEIGPDLTTKLLAEHKTVQTSAARFQIDKDLLAEAIPKELLKNKDKLNAYRGIVETELIKWKQANPGKVPTLDEQKKIARSANAEYVEIGTVWNSTIRAYDVKEGKTRAVPADFHAALKAKGAKDTEILAAWALKQKAGK